MIYENSNPYIKKEDYKMIAWEARVDIKLVEKFIWVCLGCWLLIEWEYWLYNNRILENLEKRKWIREARADAWSRWWRMKQAKEKGTHSKQDWEEMKDFFWSCVRCWDSHNIEKDHIVAVYNGWSDSIENIQPLCKRCNTAKWPDETDYRLLHCEANAKQMLSKWVAESSKVKESKVKESKVKEKEIKEKDIEIVTQSNKYLESMDYLKSFNEQSIIPLYAINYRKDWIQFCLYWTESWKNWKIRAEWQKTFELQRRFATWMWNKKNNFEQKPKASNTIGLSRKSFNTIW